MWQQFSCKENIFQEESLVLLKFDFIFMWNLTFYQTGNQFYWYRFGWYHGSGDSKKRTFIKSTAVHFGNQTHLISSLDIWNIILSGIFNMNPLIWMLWIWFCIHESSLYMPASPEEFVKNIFLSKSSRLSSESSKVFCWVFNFVSSFARGLVKCATTLFLVLNSKLLVENDIAVSIVFCSNASIIPGIATLFMGAKIGLEDVICLKSTCQKQIE